MNRHGKVERSGKAAKAGKVAKGPLFKLLAGVVPLSNNPRRNDIIAMMPEFNAHGLVPNWDEPPEDQVQEFFDTLEEKYVSAEPRLVQDITQAELDYIAARVAALAAWRMRPRRSGRRRSSAVGGIRWEGQ